MRLECQKGIFIVTEINYGITLTQLQKYTDDELYKLFIYAKRDRDEIFHANCIYWMCTMEINRRKYDKWPVEMNVISYVNIYDEDHNTIFGFGNQYQMYIISGTILIYDDNLVPHIFSSIEDDARCVWKYFCQSKCDSCENNMNLCS